MWQTDPTSFSSVLAAAMIICLICAPWALVWLAFSVRRSLHRMANALEAQASAGQYTPRQGVAESTPHEPRGPGHVSHSAFGR